MRPASFEYTRASTIAETLKAMAAGAIPLAGGQSLLPAMRLRQAEPRAIVDLTGVRELGDGMEITDGCFRIGARMTHAAFTRHEAAAREVPWLRQAALAVGDVQVRNLGTVLGNLCWADPRANMAVALLASDAIVHAIAPGEPAQLELLPVDGLFAGFRETVLYGRLATAVEIPRRPDARGCYLEFARQPQDLALASVCVVTGPHGARVAAGGVHSHPVRLRAAEAALAEGRVGELGAALEQDLDASKLAPPADHYGSAAYKLALAATLVRRAVARLTDSPS